MDAGSLGEAASSLPRMTRQEETAAAHVMLHVHGAAGTVTGSCHRLVTRGGGLLIDCGIFQGPKSLQRTDEDLCNAKDDHRHDDQSGDVAEDQRMHIVVQDTKKTCRLA